MHTNIVAIVQMQSKSKMSCLDLFLLLRSKNQKRTSKNIVENALSLNLIMKIRRTDTASHWRLRSARKFTNDLNAAANNGAPEPFSGDNEDIVCAKSLFGGDAKGLQTSLGNTRTAVLDGTKVTFELSEEVTQKPSTGREERLKKSFTNANAIQSNWDLRARLFLMRFGAVKLTCAYLAVFATLTSIFAGLFMLHADKCCGDPLLNFGHNLAFSVQTATTIGYGTYSPVGVYQDFLVVIISVLFLVLNTVYGGLLFLQFITPICKIQFSNIITYSNIHGLPCLEIRVGNCDGTSNTLIGLEASLDMSTFLSYNDEMGVQRSLGHTEALKLMSDKRHALQGMWTVRHVVDEHSPLFGLRLDEHPGTEIVQLELRITGTQGSTGLPVAAQVAYQTEDVVIGHRFLDQITWDEGSQELCCDFSKTDITEPAPVWYPCPRTKPIRFKEEKIIQGV